MNAAPAIGWLFEITDPLPLTPTAAAMAGALSAQQPPSE
jgi:hypothetical protein